jgi:IMP dehydrogenase/GMP reductase
MKSNIKFDWNDISIIPEYISSISSRKEIDPTYDGKLPIFTAPMDKVIDETNVKLFEEMNINICLPRHVKYDVLKNDNYFYSYGLDEIIELLDNNAKLPKKVLIDVANGHMKKLYDTAKRIKEIFGKEIELMVGNIANPDTYREYCEIGVDYIRLNIGSGSACTTAANVGIFYPSASLVNECYQISKEFDNPTKIIVDGGFRNTSEIIKALALGGFSVMLGGIFNKCLESCSDNFIKDDAGKYQPISKEDAKSYWNEGGEIWKYYRGMSTKEVQKFWNKSELKTGEGITKYNKVEYTLNGWAENFIDYLKSAMSYTDSRNLSDFIGEVEFINISENSFKRFHK